MMMKLQLNEMMRQQRMQSEMPWSQQQFPVGGSGSGNPKHQVNLNEEIKVRQNELLQQTMPNSMAMAWASAAATQMGLPFVWCSPNTHKGQPVAAARVAEAKGNGKQGGRSGADQERSESGLGAALEARERAQRQGNRVPDDRGGQWKWQEDQRQQLPKGAKKKKAAGEKEAKSKSSARQSTRASLLKSSASFIEVDNESMVFSLTAEDLQESLERGRSLRRFVTSENVDCDISVLEEADRIAAEAYDDEGNYDKIDFENLR